LAVVIELSWFGLFICARNSGRVLAGRSLLASASNRRYYHSQLQLLKARADVDLCRHQLPRSFEGDHCYLRRKHAILLCRPRKWEPRQSRARHSAPGLTSPKRYELAPDIPTIAEQGLPGYATDSRAASAWHLRDEPPGARPQHARHTAVAAWSRSRRAFRPRRPAAQLVSA